MADVFRGDQAGYESLWGKTVVRLGLSPLSDEAQKLYRNSPALIFSATALREVEQEQFDKLGELLGTTWTREQVEAMIRPPDGRPGKPRSRLIIPHLIGSNPKLLEFVRKSFGSSRGIDPPDWYSGSENVVEGWDMDRQDFIRLASIFTPMIDSSRLNHG